MKVTGNCSLSFMHERHKRRALNGYRRVQNSEQNLAISAQNRGHIASMRLSSGIWPSQLRPRLCTMQRQPQHQDQELLKESLQKSKSNVQPAYATPIRSTNNDNSRLKHAKDFLMILYFSCHLGIWSFSHYNRLELSSVFTNCVKKINRLILNSKL